MKRYEPSPSKSPPPPSARLVSYILDRGDYGVTPSELALAWLRAVPYESVMEEEARLVLGPPAYIFVRVGTTWPDRERLIAELLVCRAMRILDCYDEDLVAAVAEELLENCSPTAMRNSYILRVGSGFRFA